MGGARSKGSKGVEDFKPYITRSIPVGARIVCADNSGAKIIDCLLYTSPSPRDRTRSRMPSSA